MTEQSVSGRIFAVLELFLYSDEPMSLTEVSECAGLPMPTAYRYLRDLVTWGGVEKTLDGRYQIGAKIWRLGSTSPWERTIRRESRSLISAVSFGLHHAVALTMLQDGHIICIDRMWGSDPSIYLVDSGDEIPLPPSGAGRIMLSGLEEHEVIQTLKDAEKRSKADTNSSSEVRFVGPYDANRMLTKICEAKERGYALQSGELRPGQTALSVPVNVPHLQTQLALSILTPIGHRATVDLLPHIKNAAVTLERRLSKLKPLR